MCVPVEVSYKLVKPVLGTKQREPKVVMKINIERDQRNDIK